MVDIRINVEITMTRVSNKKGNKRFIKIGNTSLNAAMNWDEYFENHRRVHPLTKIEPREIINNNHSF